MSIAFGALLASGSTTAMAAKDKASLGQCHLATGSKLSADLSTAVCAEIQDALAKAVPGSRFSVEVTAMSRSRLAAELTLNDKILPRQNFAVMDSEIDRRSIRVFAKSLAELARAERR